MINLQKRSIVAITAIAGMGVLISGARSQNENSSRPDPREIPVPAILYRHETATGR